MEASAFRVEEPKIRTFVFQFLGLVCTGHWPRLPHFDVSQSQYSVAGAATRRDHEINIGGAGGIMERASTHNYFPPCWVAAVGYYARNKRRGRTKVSLSASVLQCWHQCIATFTTVISLPSRMGNIVRKTFLVCKTFTMDGFVEKDLQILIVL